MVMRFIPAFLVLVVISGFAFMTPAAKIRYIPLGDSYTICTGAKKDQAWPLLLTNHLKEKGIDIELVDNPARNGFTTFDLMEQELPFFDKSSPTFTTLCIGVNDWVQTIDSTVFKKNFSFILDRIQKTLPDKSKIIILTIPDFSVTPNGPVYSNGRNIMKGIMSFNGIIKREADKRQLKVVDLFPISQAMWNNEYLVALDGLHPSAAEYAIWEKAILPVAEEMLKEK